MNKTTSNSTPPWMTQGRWASYVLTITGETSYTAVSSDNIYPLASYTPNNPITLGTITLNKLLFVLMPDIIPYNILELKAYPLTGNMEVTAIVVNGSIYLNMAEFSSHIGTQIEIDIFYRPMEKLV